MPRSLHHGFSLLELSIVLVVIALAAGGILAGTSLLRSAEVRAVLREYEEYSSAVGAFRLQYHAVPGDMPNATEFWGRADNGSFSGQCGNPLYDEGTGTQTCNGDGNGWIDQYAAGGTEPFRFWQHLSSAGLIPERYSGIGGPSCQYEHIIGVNTPLSHAGSAGWSTSDEGPGHVPDSPWPSAMIWRQAGEEHAALWLGTRYTINNAGGCAIHTQGPAFTPEEVWSIDRKVDDGKPGLGAVHVVHYAPCTESGADDYETAAYKLGEQERVCAIRFGNLY